MAKIFSSNVTKKYYNNNYLIKGLGMCCSKIKYFGLGGKVGFKQCLGNWGIKREVWANGDFLAFWMKVCQIDFWTLFVLYFKKLKVRKSIKTINIKIINIKKETIDFQ